MEAFRCLTATLCMPCLPTVAVAAAVALPLLRLLLLLLRGDVTLPSLRPCILWPGVKRWDVGRLGGRHVGWGCRAPSFALAHCCIRFATGRFATRCIGRWRSSWGHWRSQEPSSPAPPFGLALLFRLRQAACLLVPGNLCSSVAVVFRELHLTLKCSDCLLLCWSENGHRLSPGLWHPVADGLFVEPTSHHQKSRVFSLAPSEVRGTNTFCTAVDPAQRAVQVPDKHGEVEDHVYHGCCEGRSRPSAAPV